LTDRPYTASDFDYELPPELVAQTPNEERTASRLLLVRRAADQPLIEDLIFSDLMTLIPAGDLLVLNTTRVRPARLLGRRPSGAPAEVLLIRPTADGSWLAMGKPGSALEPGKRIQLEPNSWIETIEILPDGHRRVRVVGASGDDVMHRIGRVPLPPYITREPGPLDNVRYQTVYARREGSVAAPTAGLHFTNQMLDALSAKGVVIAGLDLEVGSGTFKPVETEQIENHPMHSERYEIPDRLAALTGEIRRLGGRIWAVGTTVVRALESASDESGRVRAGVGETSLLVLPGYRFKVIDRLITNFHLPRSTLLMLVCAFGGRDAVLAAYQHAIARRYRFYSYGDAMVLL
jgi:S-adenosylmethionine:tRNA ribosyltransferase-isomerase